MSEKYAVRNLRLCTKDCLCLYVCPTGATDTENSIIDVEKCIGCGTCSEVCPSAAISMVPKKLPVQQKKKDDTIKALRAIISNKIELENIARSCNSALMVAAEKSSRLVAEDLSREAGFMIPQSGNSKAFLESLIGDETIPQDIIKDLLNTINFNEESSYEKNEIVKWKCSVCGYIHEGKNPPALCPICKQPAEKFFRVE
ncbi:rubredoxin-like domain-containing protein [Anaerofustis stercorihominis]|uniref:rubredoxin-like domain-containing protein n=1 Tax=Anaerofustis stercorihominis TaxID=214853 RepID=UPI001FAAB681|nr:4Fe-4S binding protein [Anaerofustis stercorihominis]